MKYLIAVFCLAGIAVISAAPFAEPVGEQIAPEEGQKERAAEVPEVAPGAGVAERAAEVPEDNVAEKAAGTPQAAAGNVANRSADNPDAEERSIMPSLKDVIDAVETKYLTPDGRALLKSIVPFA